MAGFYFFSINILRGSWVPLSSAVGPRNPLRGLGQVSTGQKWRRNENESIRSGYDLYVYRN